MYSHCPVLSIVPTIGLSMYEDIVKFIFIPKGSPIPKSHGRLLDDYNTGITPWYIQVDRPEQFTLAVASIMLGLKSSGEIVVLK